MPTNYVSRCHISSIVEHFQGQWLHHLPDRLYQCLTALSERKRFLTSNQILPLAQHKDITSHSIAVTWEKRLTPTSLQPPFRGCSEQWCLPEPPLPQTEQSLFPQPLRLMFQTLHSFLALKQQCSSTSASSRGQELDSSDLSIPHAGCTNKMMKVLERNFCQHVYFYYCYRLASLKSKEWVPSSLLPKFYNLQPAQWKAENTAISEGNSGK